MDDGMIHASLRVFPQQRKRVLKEASVFPSFIIAAAGTVWHIMSGLLNEAGFAA